MVTVGNAAVQGFKAGFAGIALTPDDDGYDEARALWNGWFDKHPAVIARCRTTDDVISVVGFARESGLPLAIRSGGHSLAGLSSCDDGIMLDLSLMRDVVVDADARTARVQAGATWADFDAATQAHGLASTGGLISHTGVAGLTLGGGIGWLMRKFGLAADNLTGAELVTASGRDRAGEQLRAAGAAVGSPWRRRQLRRRHELRVPPASAGHRRRRAHGVPARPRARGARSDTAIGPRKRPTSSRRSRR